MNYLLRTILATMMALATLFALLKITSSNETLPPTSPTDDTFVYYLPIIQRTTSPAGAYHCDETEFSMIWRSEVITLNINSSSIYEYYYPFRRIITGTWVYTPSMEVVGFTNFGWLTTTFQPPDRLRNSWYVTPAGFEVAINCNRLP